MRGEGEEAGGGIDAEKKTEQPRGARLSLSKKSRHRASFLV